MKKIIFVCCLILSVASVAAAKIKVVTTTQDLAALAREVGGEFVDVESLTRGDQDPHYIEPKPSYAMRLNRADLVIEVGLDLEIGWLPVLLLQARNPKLALGSLGLLDASEGLPILEVPTGKIDRSQGDIHPLGNPHYWLNPNNGIIVAQHIAQRLAELDPSHAANFQQNAEGFAARLKTEIKKWESELAPFKGRKVVIYHKSFSYFAAWSGLTVAAMIEPKPGIPPSPAYLVSLIDLMGRDRIAVILTENFYDPKPSASLAAKTGAKLLLLPTSVQGEPAVRTYDDLFQTIVTRLTEAR